MERVRLSAPGLLSVYLRGWLRAEEEVVLGEYAELVYEDLTELAEQGVRVILVGFS